MYLSLSVSRSLNVEYQEDCGSSLGENNEKEADKEGEEKGDSFFFFFPLFALQES